MATGHHDILAGIAVDEAGLIPCGGYLLHEVNLELRLFSEVARSKSEVLTTRLESNGGSQLEDIAGATCIALARLPVETLLQNCTAIFHRSDGVANKGMEAGMARFHIAETLTEIEVLGGKDSLGTAVVGIHLLPTARQGATVEDDLNTVVVGIGENAFVEAHGLLFVTTEEIDLNTSHTTVAQPFHLLLADNGIVHALAGILRGIVPTAVRVVPHPGTDALLLAIGKEFLHALATDMLVPAAIDEAAFPTEGGSKVDVLHLIVVVDAGVLPQNPRPRVA